MGGDEFQARPASAGPRGGTLHMMKSRIALAATLLLAGAAPILAQPMHAAADSRPAAAARYGGWGVDLDARDPSFRPGDDFFRYANNSWFQRNPIPADRTSYSLWTLLDQEIEQQVKAIVEGGGNDPVARQVG